MSSGSIQRIELMSNLAQEIKISLITQHGELFAVFFNDDDELVVAAPNINILDENNIRHTIQLFETDLAQYGVYNENIYIELDPVEARILYNETVEDDEQVDLNEEDEETEEEEEENDDDEHDDSAAAGGGSDEDDDRVSVYAPGIAEEEDDNTLSVSLSVHDYDAPLDGTPTALSGSLHHHGDSSH